VLKYLFQNLYYFDFYISDSFFKNLQSESSSKASFWAVFLTFSPLGVLTIFGVTTLNIFLFLRLMGVVLAEAAGAGVLNKLVVASATLNPEVVVAKKIILITHMSITIKNSKFYQPARP